MRLIERKITIRKWLCLSWGNVMSPLNVPPKFFLQKLWIVLKIWVCYTMTSENKKKSPSYLKKPKQSRRQPKVSGYFKQAIKSFPVLLPAVSCSARLLSTLAWEPASVTHGSVGVCGFVLLCLVSLEDFPTSTISKWVSVCQYLLNLSTKAIFSGHQTLVLTYTDVFRCHGIAYSNLQDNIHNFWRKILTGH